VVSIVTLQFASVNKDEFPDHQAEIKRFGSQHLWRSRQSLMWKNFAIDDVLNIL
jgi:hypothetical protein